MSATDHNIEIASELQSKIKKEVIKGSSFRDALISCSLVESQSLLDRWFTTIYRQSKKNAKQRGIDFSLTKEDYEQIKNRSNYKCEISGIPFQLVQLSSSKRRPYAPSLDRINSSKGYEKDNVRLVCIAANYAMNQWGEEVLLKLASSVASFHNLDIPAASTI